MISLGSSADQGSHLSLFSRLIAGFVLSLVATAAMAQDPPTLRVDNIRVEGLQRVSEGTVYNYLPVNIGDRITQQRVREAIRALYDTGFFRDVELRFDEGTLIVAVLERPSIESFELKGNKDIGEKMDIAEAQTKLAEAMAQLQALERLRKNLKH